MANLIQVKRGLYASLPTLAAGELGFSTDTYQVHIGDGAANHELALKTYVDSVATGLILKASCRVATTDVLPACTPAGSGVGKTLTADAVGVLTIDGVDTVLNDRILVKNQVAGDDNGIYKVTTEGTAGVAFVLTRATDFDADAEVVAGSFTFITEGAANGDEGWVLTTNNPITVDTTSLTFAQFSSASAPVSTFLGLTDTPANYTDDTLKIVRVNVGETALEFVGFTATYLEASPTNGELNKAPNSDWAFDHAAATTGVHGAGANTLLHSGSTIDGGAYA